MKCLIALIALFSFYASAADLDPKIAQLFQDQITAIEINDLSSFVKNGTANFQDFKKADFDKVDKEYLPLFKAGYESTYLTSLKQEGLQVYLWKLSFKNGRDDILVKLAINKENKIAGFWFQ